MEQGFSFDRPSTRYDEALPLGNGRLGAMVSGAIRERLIWLNEETVWYGGPRDRNNPDAAAHIDTIKRYVAEKRIQEAEQLAVLTLTGVPESQRHFTTLGLAVLTFLDQEGEVSHYRHSLDFASATATTSYEMGGVRYQMQVHANRPESALIIHLQADQPVLHFYAGVERGERVGQFSYGTHQDGVVRYADQGLSIYGSCGGKDGLDFSTALFGESNGTTCVLGDKVVVQGASEATLYVTAATNFAFQGDLVDHVAGLARSAREKGYARCYQNHREEWEPAYAAAGFSLNIQQQQPLPAMNRIFDAWESGKEAPVEWLQAGHTVQELNDSLTSLLFAFGRYTLLSASRCGELPAALQGLWCRDLLPAWDGKYTTNINLQMAYWPADAVNMSQCFEPYIQFALRVRENGMETARKMYHCRGFVLHNNTDIWADTAVQDSGTHCSYWFLGGVWMAIDLYEHFRYTQDRRMLQRIWPVMRDAALFLVDFMEEVDGKYVMGVTSVPENFYYDSNGNKVSFCPMCAMDAQLIPLLFDQCVEAAGILTETFGQVEAEEGLIQQLKDMRQKIDPPKIGADGSILEWSQEVREAEPGHRHLSHLVGAYPYNFITEKQPELLRAVEISLEKRIRDGGCQTGWGRVWGAGLMARLKRGNDARDLVCTMLQRCGQPNLFSCCNVTRVPKLLENNKPMQIDGTMGTVQAVAEMLVQSYCDGELWVLPALPDSWQEGSFHGFRARGNHLVDAGWKNARLASARITAGTDQTVEVICGCDFTVVSPDGQIRSAQGRARVPFRAGTVYELVPVLQ